MIAKLLFGSAVAAALIGANARSAEAGCTSGSTAATTVNRTFTGGAQFTFGINHDNCTGLEFTVVSYKPQGGTLMQVLNRAAIAEIHVPYNKGTPRFLDISADTSGLGANAVTLSAAECPGGTLFSNNKICVMNHDGGYAWKNGTSFKKAEAIEVFMSSQLGRYNYINKWTFHSDGSIEPSVGLTGQLQIISTGAAFLPFGARLNPESSPTVSVGADHQHNVYYRLDFDLNGAANDVISRRLVSATTSPAPGESCATPGQCSTVSFTPITVEAAQTFSASGQTTWLVQDKVTLNADGRRIGYEIAPKISGLWRGMTTTTEPYAGSDFWVTSYNSCELLAAGNAVPQIPSGCTGVANNVQAMVNGESTDGADVVAWYVNRMQHHTRDEDQSMMPIEWMHFEIAPVSFSASNPTEAPIISATSASATTSATSARMAAPAPSAAPVLKPIGR